MRTEIRIGGFGGQGVIMAGVIIRKAASLFDNKNAVQTQSYGPEARGGAYQGRYGIYEPLRERIHLFPRQIKASPRIFQRSYLSDHRQGQSADHGDPSYSRECSQEIPCKYGTHRRR